MTQARVGEWVDQSNFDHPVESKEISELLTADSLSIWRNYRFALNSYYIVLYSKIDIHPNLSGIYLLLSFFCLSNWALVLMQWTHHRPTWNRGRILPEKPIEPDLFKMKNNIKNLAYGYLCCSDCNLERKTEKKFSASFQYEFWSWRLTMAKFATWPTREPSVARHLAWTKLSWTIRRLKGRRVNVSSGLC